VAHELNTPLGTLTLMVDDLLEEGATDAQRDDFVTMKMLLEVCRDRVKELAAPAEANESLAPVDLERVIERWQLLRPTIELRRTGTVASDAQVDPAVGYLLQALLSNAADASQQAGNARVDLDLSSDDTGLRGEIRDYGVGFDEAEPLLPARLHRTSKPNGLGIGLALSHATIERLGGELSMEATESCGVRIAFHVPATVRS
jgi:two-component system sensor histidine kinase RegB